MILLAYLYAGLAIAAAIFTPFIMGWAVTLIWGLIARLGVVGKIVNTLLMVVIGGLLGLVPVVLAAVFEISDQTLAGSIIIVSAILIPVWYFFWHHDVVKEDVGAFGAHVLVLFLIVWYGGGLGMIVTIFNEQTGMYIAIGSVFAGIIYYVIATRDAAVDVDRDDSASFKYRWIGLAAAVCLAGALVLWNADYQKKQAVIREANKAANEAGVVTVKTAKNKKQGAIAAKYVSGTVVFVGVNGTIEMYEEANKSSKVIKELNNKGGEKLIANGEVLFDPVDDWICFVSVDYNGTKGWISESYVSPAIGIATVVADNVVFNVKYTFDAKGQAIEHPNITLKKGDTFEVLYVSKKYKSTDGVYKGTLGSVRSSDVEVTINK